MNQMLHSSHSHGVDHMKIKIKPHMRTCVKLSKTSAAWNQVDIIREYPFCVHHKIPYGFSEWAIMWTWLDVHVGAMGDAWSWQVSSEIRFKNEQDATQFSLTWS